jgi:hypothetical protein
MQDAPRGGRLFLCGRGRSSSQPRCRLRVTRNGQSHRPGSRNDGQQRTMDPSSHVHRGGSSRSAGFLARVGSARGAGRTRRLCVGRDRLRSLAAPRPQWPVGSLPDALCWVPHLDPCHLAQSMCFEQTRRANPASTTASLTSAPDRRTADSPVVARAGALIGCASIASVRMPAQVAARVANVKNLAEFIVCSSAHLLGATALSCCAHSGSSSDEHRGNPCEPTTNPPPDRIGPSGPPRRQGLSSP